VEIISTFPSLDLENFHQKKTNKKKKSVEISLKRNEPIYLTNEPNLHLKMQFRHGKHLHVNFYHFFYGKSFFVMKNMKRKFPPVFPSLFFYFSMHEATVVRGIEVLAGILKIIQVNQDMERIKFQLFHFPHKIFF
jgi:hypothetical protein